MTWLKTDDGYYDHPKIRALGLDEYVLHHGGQILAARLETDGVITEDQLFVLARKGLTNPAKVVTKLVDRGLWAVIDGGWQIHDFLDYNPSREQLERKRADGARRQRESRKRRMRESHVDDTRPSPDESHRDVTRDSQGESQRPDPTRPDPTPSGDESSVENTRSVDDRVPDEEEQDDPGW